MADTPHERVEKIEEVSGSSNGDATNVVETADKMAPTKEAFDASMSKLPPPPVQLIAVAEPPTQVKRSLMDEVRALNQRVDNVGKTNTGDLVAQAKELITQIEDVKAKLATPGIEIKESVQTLLKNKLSHIDESLKIALNKAGAEYTPPSTTPKLTNPIDRFLGLLTHGQHQLQSLSTELEQAANSKEQFSPAKMLSVQLKVNYISQEIELFTNLLNKALESTKTIMNVQV